MYKKQKAEINFNSLTLEKNGKVFDVSNLCFLIEMDEGKNGKREKKKTCWY